MIVWSVAVPAVGAIAAGLAAGRFQRRMWPPTAALLLTLLAGTAAIACAALVFLLAGIFLTHLSDPTHELFWCPVPHGHDVPVWFGAASVAAGGAMAASVWSTLRQLGWSRGGRSDPLVVVPTDDATAFAVPGRPGHVVVSTGMLRRLDGEERRVLLAHERAHLEHHHHRYLWVAAVAAAAAPPLRPVLGTVRFATERWADEIAAREVGDRRLVARTIARAALVQSASPRLALAGHGVRARVDALLEEPSRPGVVQLATLAVVAATMAGVVSSAVQLHHVAAVLTHLCR